MSFKLYLAGGDAVPIDLTKDDCVGILTTFADGPKSVKKLIDKRHCNIFCDSGAYGIAHSGKNITIDDYIKFINETPECEVFAVLDEIAWPEKNEQTLKTSAENTWKNYCYMLDRVKPEYHDKLVCTFHANENIDYLYQLIDGYKGYKPKYIAFGGRAGISTKRLYYYLDNYFWPTVRKSSNPNIKIHAFGVTVFDIIEKYPWYSADSTTWLRCAINGNIHSRHNKGVVNISDRKDRAGRLNHLNHFIPELRDLIMNEIASYGFTLQELVDDYKKRQLWNCIYYKEWADNYVYKPHNKPLNKGLF